MHSPSGFSNPAAAMIVRRFAAIGALICVGAMLGACAPFAGFVADHVPHWAGGLPPDVPPRPGAPGYDDFIAHGEPAPTTATPPSGVEPGAAPAAASTGTIPPNNAAATSEPQFQVRNPQAGNNQAGNGKVQRGRARPAPAQPAPAQASAQRAPQATAPAEPAEVPAAEDQSAVKGGLY
jgi:hypothetical protein